MNKIFILKVILFFKQKILGYTIKIFRPLALWNVRVYAGGSIHIGQGSRLKSGSSLRTRQKNDQIYIDKNVWISEFVDIDAADNGRVIIKSGTTIQDRCKIFGHVTIERDSILAHNVYMSSGDHTAFLKPYQNIRDQEKINIFIPTPVHIEEDVWIGGNVLIKRGISIGRGAIVGANSVVTKDISPYSVCAGVPAVKIKQRFNFFSYKEKIEAIDENDWPYFYRGFKRPSMKALDKNIYFVLGLKEHIQLKIVYRSDKINNCILTSASYQQCRFDIFITEDKSSREANVSLGAATDNKMQANCFTDKSLKNFHQHKIELFELSFFDDSNFELLSVEFQ